MLSTVDAGKFGHHGRTRLRPPDGGTTQRWHRQPSLREMLLAGGVAVFVAAPIVWIMAPGADGDAQRGLPPAPWYVASVTLSHDVSAPELPVYLQTLLEGGVVPSRVATHLEAGTPQQVADGLDVEIADAGRSMILQFSDPDPATAQAAVDLFGDELVAYLTEQRIARRDADADRLARQLEEERAALADAGTRAEASPDDPLLSVEVEARRATYLRTYSELRSVLVTDVTSPTVVDSEVDVVARSAGGAVSSTPHSVAVSLGTLGALAVALLSALTLGAFDRRVRSAADIESATGLPVLLEVSRDAEPNKRNKEAVRTIDPIQRLRALLSAGPPSSGTRIVAVTALSREDDAAWLAAELAAGFVKAGLHTRALRSSGQRGRHFWPAPLDGRDDGQRERSLSEVIDQMETAARECDVLVVHAPLLDRLDVSSMALTIAHDVVLVASVGANGDDARKALELLSSLGSRPIGVVFISRPWWASRSAWTVLRQHPGRGGQ